MTETIKGVGKLTRYLNKWLKEKKFNCRTGLDLDFGYNSDEQKIYYSFLISEKHDKWFIKICQDCRPELINCDNFILSFFHELGHYATSKKVTEEEWDDYYQMLDEFSKRKVLYKRDYIRYYTHPVEYKATTWGCNYIVRHRKIVTVWWDKVRKLIQDIYKENEISTVDF